MNNGLMPLMGFPTAEVNYTPPGFSQAAGAELTAGGTIYEKSLVALVQNGKAYQGGNSDFVSVANQGSTALAETTLGSGLYTDETEQMTGRMPVLYGNDAIYVVSPYSTNKGCKLYKYSTAGALLASVNVDTSGTYGMRGAQLAVMPNGNVVLLYMLSSGSGVCKAMVYDSNLGTVQTISFTALNGGGDYTPSLCGLSAGGFTVTYVYTGDNKLHVGVYNSSGVQQGSDIIFTAASLWGSNGVVSLASVELSNGDVAVCGRIASGGYGFRMGIVRPSNQTVTLQDAQIITGNNTNERPQMVATSDGYFAVTAYADTLGGVRCLVFNNAGTLQGAGTTLTTSGWLNCQTAFVYNNEMYVAWYKSSTTSVTITTLPKTGTGYANTEFSSIPNAGGTSAVIATVKDNFLAITQRANGGNYPLKYSIIDLSTMALIQAVASFGAAVTTSQVHHNSRLLDDCMLAVWYSDSSSAAVKIAMVKVLDTCIMGVALNTVGPGSKVTVDIAAGVKGLSQTLRGSLAKQFDHSTADLYGNKGSILPGAVILRGM